jgi:predicted TIM-barrel fold metal-dependent hydrolase
VDKQFKHAFDLKQRFPDKVYVFGGFDYRALSVPDFAGPVIPFEQQLQDMIDVGCDGLKMLIGKPDQRKAIGVPLDAPVFTPMLDLLERTGFPVLWHVGDPPEFWSEKTVPPWARQRGWWYDETHPKKPQIDEEIARVFKRHPKLRLILPHFFFLSDQLDKAAALLDAYPSYSIDLAPGVEMFHNMTANREASRAFFIKYADRIIFGSDFGMGCGWSRDRGMMIRRFLETEEPYEVPDDPAMAPDDRPALRGIALPREVLRKIYVDNFVRLAGDRPRPLDMSKCKPWMCAAEE